MDGILNLPIDQIQGLYELHMGWGLVEPIDAQPSRGYCDDGREINFVARDVIDSEIDSRLLKD